MSAADTYFLLPGDPATPTGGFVYDRHAIQALSRANRLAGVVRIDAGFPDGSAAALMRACGALSQLPDYARLVVDGLAFTALTPELARQADRLRLVALVHHMLGDESGLQPGESRRWLGRETAALSLARRIIVTSATTRRRLEDLGIAGRRIVAVPPGVDAAPEPGLRSRNHRGETINLLCVASLIPRKGQHILIDALARLSDRPWRLDLVGAPRDPAYAERLRRTIGQAGLGSRVILHGAVCDSALDGFWRAADLFVFASLYEGWGIAPVEAVRWGLPVVTTDAGALRESVPVRARRMVPADDPNSLADVLAELLDHPDRLAELAAGSRSEAGALRRWTAMRVDFLAALEGV